MAIAYDSSSKWESAGGGNTTTFAHTCSGSDRILIVGVSCWVNGSAATTGVTYNWVAMTLIATQNRGVWDLPVSLWYLIAPATGSNNVVATTVNATERNCVAISYTWVNQSGQPDATTTFDTTATTSYSKSITTIADNCRLVWRGLNYPGAGNITMTNGNILRQACSTTLGTYLVDSNSAKTPAWSHAVTWTQTSQANRGVMISVKPVSNTSNFFTFLTE